MSDLVARRLRAHRLIGEPFASAKEAVAWFGAVQSQDYPAAKWAVGQRVSEAIDADLDRAFDKGDILRTHVLRPTWHFVLPADIKWIQELTSSRVLAGLAGRHRQLELDSRTKDRAADVFGEALAGGRFLTRPELGEALKAQGVNADGQRLPHLIAAAEHANVITSGPRRGKQFTYALLAERAPKARKLDRDQALEELTIRYFRSHGPAQLKDFGWWSGLTVLEIRKGIDLAGNKLQRERIDGADYWSGGDAGARSRNSKAAHLLPNFDEYTVAYRDRIAVLDPAIPYDGKSFAYYRDASPMGGVLSNIVTIGGRVRGAWSRRVEPKGVRVDVKLLTALTPVEASAVKRAAAKLGTFLGSSKTELHGIDRGGVP
ncbi:MAG TPA: winged helix DNA-binding domain-containing protein [Candidatus Dormibacteraeota bacterium]|nr:winged helix DNA-binding domain-containing protein [Candidatus Dormibacteraeota bacterium]